MLQWYYRGFSGGYRVVTRVLQECYKEAIQVLQGIFPKNICTFPVFSPVLCGTGQSAVQWNEYEDEMGGGCQIWSLEGVVKTTVS